MTRLAAALLLVSSTLAAACGTGSPVTSAPTASGCVPTYLVADARRLVTIVDAADRTNETTGGALELDLAAARLSVLDGPSSLATDTATLDRLIGEAEVLLATTDAKKIALARLAPAAPLTPEPFKVTVSGGSYAIVVAPVVEFEVIIDGCPNEAGQIGKATIRINPIPSDALGITRRCTDDAIEVERISAEATTGKRFEGFTNAVTQPELDGLHAARCAG